MYAHELYIHDMDRRAFDALNAFPIFVKLKEAYIAGYDEKAAKIDFLSTAIRLNENQMPEIYSLLPPVCEKLGIDVPELYYVRSKEMNAATGGSTNPYIFVTSELVEKIPVDLIGSVVAHECGHIACRHYLYHSLAVQLIDGIEKSRLSAIPAIRKYLTPTLVRALLFWDRCSELSADRAAALCDGGADKTVDMLLKINGYPDNINREEFIKQALDLKEFVNDSKFNKLLEQMLIQGESHPRMATRVYECYEWAHSDKFSGIINGTYTLADKKEHSQTEIDTQEVVAADIEVEASGEKANSINIDDELARVNRELEKYTNHADKADYSFAVASGLCAGMIDSLFVGAFSLEEAHDCGSEKTEKFVVKVAKAQGYDGDDIKGAIIFLAEKAPHSDNKISPGFHLASDSSTNDFGGGKQHHLRDFAHHATLTGLVFSMLTQFTEKSYGTDTSGKFIVVDVKNKEFIGKDIPQKFLFGTVYWFFHMVSDVAGSGKMDSEGTGIPGPLLSVAKLLSATPLFKNQLNEKDNREFSVFISKLFNGTLFGKYDDNGKMIPVPFDFRTELGIAHHLTKQALPVILNEVFVRSFYFLRRLVNEIVEKKISRFDKIRLIDWEVVKPVGNRTVDRMLTVSTMTFTIADTTDAAVRAAVESGGNWVLFAGRFVTRFNYVGAGRAAVAIIREVSNEKKEAQLVHEKLILTEVGTQFVIQQLETYKAGLEEQLSDYIAEDIEAFITGFDFMNQGLASGNYDLVIKGNVVIQRVLGREPQFTNQEEFDSLMDSEIPLIF